MKIVLIGATGLLGTPMVQEAANRGHQVTAVCRHPEAVAKRPGVTALACDVFDEDGLTEIIKGHDAVIHCYSPRRDFTVNRSEPHKLATQSILNATRRAGVRRLLAAGGAGSLEVAPGIRLMDTAELPAAYMESAVSTVQIYYMLQKEKDLDWTFLCPSAVLAECGRTGKFRLGTDQLLRDRAGNSAISFEDFGVAMIDELEQPKHTGMRFTVGY